MMLDSNALETALELLQDEKPFYQPAHRQLFAVMKELVRNDRAVDMVILNNELRTRGLLATVGGAEYLTELINSVATAAHVEHYARIVEEKFILRELINAATSMVTKCFGDGGDPGPLLDEAEGEIFKIAETMRKKSSGLTPINAMMHEMLENLEMLHQKKENVTGVPTGFKRFDEMTAGLQPGNLVILAARPGVGKTAFALNIALHVGMNKKMPVAVYSLEMSKIELGMRLLSSACHIALSSLRTGFFSTKDWPNITRKAEMLSESPIHMDDGSGLSILTLRSSARKLAAQLKKKGTPLSLIIIDYLQLMQGSRRNPESRQVEIAEISRSLKGLARDLGIPIIALSQLNRSTEERGRDGKPQLSDLRESGAIEQDADLVAFIYREGMYKKLEGMAQEEINKIMSQAKLMIAKQRNGPLGEVDLVFMRESATFGNPDPEFQ
jgi:replicative DNA helicase